MQGIFVSYRREDSAGHTGRLFDRLSSHFGKDRVFMDISDIEPGVDFVESIESALSDCEVMLVMIGRSWGSCTDADGQRRLDDPNDFIRLESATALDRNISVIPVLVQGARMPTAGEIPEKLHGLLRRQAIELSDTRWDYDTQQLIETLEKAASAAGSADTQAHTPAEPTEPLEAPKVSARWPRWLILPTVIVLAGMAAVWVLQKDQNPAPIKGAPIPYLVGMPIGNAKWQIEKSGFVLGTARARRTDKEKAGTVLSQNPVAGISRELNTPIALVFAEVPEVQLLSLPNLLGKDASMTRVRLEQLGMYTETKRRVVFNRKEDNIVLAQDPPAKTAVEPGSIVRLTVGSQVKYHISGSIDLKQTWTADLDTGKTGTKSGQDLWFQAVTSKERYLEPRNGARMAFFDGNSASLERCVRTKLGSTRIPIERIVGGSSLCVHTDEGRYAVVSFPEAVGARGGLLKMKFTTLERF